VTQADREKQKMPVNNTAMILFIDDAPQYDNVIVEFVPKL
jgi:hypothetical protein